MRLRRFFLAPIFGLLMAGVGLLDGQWGSRASLSNSNPNSKLMLRRLRDVGNHEAKLLAERIGSDPLELGLVGADVRVESGREGRVLIGRRNAVVGSLVPAETGSESEFTCAAPGLGEVVYVLY